MSNLGPFYIDLKGVPLEFDESRILKVLQVSTAAPRRKYHLIQLGSNTIYLVVMLLL